MRKLQLDYDALAGLGDLPALLGEKDVAKLLNVSVHYLRKSRCTGHVGNRTKAPDFVKVGRRRLYRTADVRQWVNSLIPENSTR